MHCLKTAKEMLPVRCGLNLVLTGFIVASFTIKPVWMDDTGLSVVYLVKQKGQFLGLISRTFFVWKNYVLTSCNYQLFLSREKQIWMRFNQMDCSLMRSITFEFLVEKRQHINVLSAS